MNDEIVRLPIETYREGNVITKVCVEDVYKLINRLGTIIDRSYTDATDVVESVHKEYESGNGETCIGELLVCIGTSQPCITDAFDEEIGDVIAFTKAKLKANIRKRNLVMKVYNSFTKGLSRLDEELEKINDNINKDIDKIRVYNPDYNPNF